MIKIFSEREIERATSGSSGIDLRANCGVRRVIDPGARWAIRTGVRVAMPSGCEAQVRGRSGLALNHGIVVPVGTIDSDYRGEIRVIMINVGKLAYAVHPGDRIAQLVFQPIISYLVRDAVEFVDDPDLLGETTRGDGGFGSTGIQ